MKIEINNKNVGMFCPYKMYLHRNYKVTKEKSQFEVAVASEACIHYCSYGMKLKGKKREEFFRKRKKSVYCYYRERNSKGWFSKKLYENRI